MQTLHTSEWNVYRFGSTFRITHDREKIQPIQGTAAQVFRAIDSMRDRGEIFERDRFELDHLIELSILAKHCSRCGSEWKPTCTCQA